MALDQQHVRAERPILTITQWAEVPYTPAFLLNSRFDASITDDDEFRKACRFGFDGYFDYMFGYDASRVYRCIEQVYQWSDVVSFLIEDVMSQEEPSAFLTLGWRAGFGLGWLSALAFTDRTLALMGLEVLTVLIVPSRLKS